MEVVLLGHVGATLFMVGVIWFVQIVHYPLFGLVVGPPMLVEAATAVALVARLPGSLPYSFPLLGLLLLAVVWLSMALLQSPQHGVLGGGFVPASHRFLVPSNWVRTVCWTGRGALVLLITAALLPPRKNASGVEKQKVVHMD